MGVEDQLQPGEEIVYRAHVTRISLFPWVAALAVAIVAAAVAFHGTGEILIAIAGGVVAVVLAGILLVKLLVLRSFEHVLTNRRLVQQTGILRKQSMDAPLDKVNNVEHWQTIWGRLLGYGDVEIDTASEHGATRFRNISRPLEFKSAIVGAAEAYRSQRFAPAPAAGPSGADRLRQLKALLDDGLISGEEYEAKRKKLLDEV
ncbi:MAG: PH domain-containing protein [Acidobacteriota bacterium]